MAFEADIDLQETDAHNMWRKLERGILRQTSILGALVRGEWSGDRKSRVLRSITLDHGDVSVVNFGMNPHAKVLSYNENWSEDEDEEDAPSTGGGIAQVHANYQAIIKRMTNAS